MPVSPYYDRRWRTYKSDSRDLSAEAEDREVPIPDLGPIEPGVRLGIGLPTTGPLRLRRHPVVMVAELVQENVEKLVGACCALGPFAQHPILPPLARDFETLEDVAVLLEPRNVCFPPELRLPGTQMNDSREVISVGIPLARCKHDRIEPS